MKKFISISIVIIMLITMIPVVSFASGEIKIISPEADVYTDFSQFEVECENAEKLIFKLNGVTVGETNGKLTLDVPKEKLYVGSHNLQVIAFFSNGTVSSDTKNFNVSAVIEKFSYTDTGELLGFDISQGSSAVVYEDSVGSSGQPDDKAKKLYYKSTPEDKTTKPTLRNGGVQYVQGGIKKLSFDLKLTTEKDAVFIGGMDAVMGNYGQLNSSNGFWLDGSKAHYPETDKWMHIDVFSDHYTNSGVFSVNGTPIYDGEIKTIIPGALYFRLYQYGNRTDSTRASMSIDNIFAYQAFNYYLESVEWEDSEGNWSTDTSSIPSDTSRIRIKMNETLSEDSVNLNTVCVYDNGKKVTLTDVSYNESTGYVEATLGDLLSHESEIVFEMSGDVQLKNAKIKTGIAVKAFLKTELGTYSVSDIDCEINSAAFFTTEQLSEGGRLSIDLTLNNASGQDKTMAAVACVFQNKKLLAIGACEEFVTALGKQANITLSSLSGIDLEGEISVKIMLLNSLSEPQAYSNYYELK